MSQGIIECPICEGQFQLPPNAASTQVICPFCNHQIDLDETIPMAVAVPVSPTARPSPADQVDFETAKTTGSDADSKQNIGEFSNALGDIDDRIGNRSRHREKRSLTGIILVVGLGLLGVAAAIGAYVYYQQPAEVASTSEDAQQADIQNSEDGQEAGSNAADSSQSDGNEDALQVPPPKPEFYFFTANQAEECWRKVRPHLLLLNIEDPRGKTQAVGTIVDSRGWVLTSYSAIKDAWQIEVVAARRALDQPQTTEPLKDLVRGIVVADPERDLAILAVNRRFVVSMVDLQIADGNRVVRGESLFQCGPPTRSNYYGKSEVKVEQRINTSQLDTSARAKADARKIAPDVLWMPFSGGVGLLPGMPLFKPDATLVAMTAFPVDDLGYSVAVDQRVRNLVSSATGELQSLKPIQRTASASNPENPDLQDLADGAAAVSDRVRNLQRAAIACQDFGWLPGDADQYRQLQQFARVAGETMQFIQEHRDDLRDFSRRGSSAAVEVKKLQDLIQQYKLEIHEKLNSVLKKDFDRLAQINEFAQREIEDRERGPVVFYGEVITGGDTVVAKMENKDSYVRFPFNPAAPVMLPESLWLMFVDKTDETRKRPTSVPGQKNVLALPTSFHMAISASERP